MQPVLSTSSNMRSVVRRAAVAMFVAVSVAPIVLVIASSAGDPIGSNALNPHSAGWYTNVQQQRFLTCADTCKTNANALPEYEASAEPLTKRAFVCKVPGKPAGWQYCSQFDDRAACYTVGTNLKGSYSERFMCLCVGR